MSFRLTHVRTATEQLIGGPNAMAFVRFMQILASPRATAGRPSRFAFYTALFAGTIFTAVGVALLYLVFGGDFMTRSCRPADRRPTTSSSARSPGPSRSPHRPASASSAGSPRDRLRSLAARRPRVTPAVRLRRAIGDDHVVATSVRLPVGNRVLPELVIGPFGAAVIEELPPSGAVMSRGVRTWEVRVGNGYIRTIENPLDRATHDAEIVRSLALARGRRPRDQGLCGRRRQRPHGRALAGVRATSSRARSPSGCPRSRRRSRSTRAGATGSSRRSAPRSDGLGRGGRTRTSDFRGISSAPLTNWATPPRHPTPPAAVGASDEQRLQHLDRDDQHEVRDRDRGEQAERGAPRRPRRARARAARQRHDQPRDQRCRRPAPPRRRAPRREHRRSPPGRLAPRESATS